MSVGTTFQYLKYPTIVGIRQRITGAFLEIRAKPQRRQGLFAPGFVQNSLDVLGVGHGAAIDYESPVDFQ